jgi:hypothetical protein
MQKLASGLTCLVLAGAMTVASGALAGGLYDEDDGAYSPDHRQGFSRYCHEHPYSDVCDPYHNGDAQRYGQGPAYEGGHCAALVRAVGKRNIFTVFARNSARFAWIREARFVHGDQYADWNLARNAEISCTEIGALKSCVAVGTPCRY